MRRSPGRAIGLAPSGGRPEAWASRCRTVEPGGPAGSSRSIVPSSAATRQASAVTGFVTEAQWYSRAASPSGRHRAVRRDDADGDVLGRPALDGSQGVHFAGY